MRRTITFIIISKRARKPTRWCGTQRAFSFYAIAHHILPNHRQVAVPRAERVVLDRLKRQARVNLVGDGAYQNFSLRVCAAHLDVLGYRFKRQQFRAILEDLRARPQVDVLILAGDFNTFALAANRRGRNRNETRQNLECARSRIRFYGHNELYA